MSTAPAITSEKTAGGVRVALAGGWTVDAGSQLEKRADALLAVAGGAGAATIDLSQVDQMDTAGAWVIDRSRQSLAARGVDARIIGARPEHAILLREAHFRPTEAPPHRTRVSLSSLVGDIGESVYGAGVDLISGLGFLGRMVSVGASVAVQPRRWRWTSTVFHLEAFGLRGAPIILLINFLVGAIVAQQGIFQLARFNATPFTVDLIGILVLRELGVLLTSIMIAGRSGSAITAEIGAMKMREEVDALMVMALDPMEVLILPRILALIVALPLLTFLADMAAIFGGLCVAWAYGGISPAGVHRPSARRHRPQHVRGRTDQGAVHGAGDRPDRLDRRLRGWRLRGVPGPKSDGLRRQIDLHGHRARRDFRHVFRGGAVLTGNAGEPGAAPSAPSGGQAPHETVIRVRGLKVGFGDHLVMNGLDLDVYRGEVLGFVGASGAGKSVLTRAILGLLPKRAGLIEVYGENVDKLSIAERQRVEQRWGVLFQQGALFSSLTVLQNIQAPMREHLDLSPRLRDELAMLKIDLVGLPPDAADKFPAELSGGMVKRAALARALALDPDLLFLDEPTSGLDPIGAGEFDELIATLQRTLGLTVFMVTHDLDSLYAICDRVAVLGQGRVTAIGPISELLLSQDPWIKAYFHGKRGSGREAAFLHATAAKAEP